MRVEVFKITSDDWYPSYHLDSWHQGVQKQGLVEVAFVQTGPDPKNGLGEWRVCVWGGDDCGMERDYPGTTGETECWTMFLQVIGLQDVTMNKLKTLGFRSA